MTHLSSSPSDSVSPVAVPPVPDAATSPTKTRKSRRTSEKRTESQRTPSPSSSPLVTQQQSTVPPDPIHPRTTTEGSSSNPSGSHSINRPPSSHVTSTPRFDDNDVDEDLRRLKTSLSRSQVYLGNSNLPKVVEWVDEGRRRILVLKRTNKNSKFDPAIVEWVREVSPQNFWLYPCGGWNGERGPSGSWKTPTPFYKANACGTI